MQSTGPHPQVKTSPKSWLLSNQLWSHHPKLYKQDLRKKDPAFMGGVTSLLAITRNNAGRVRGSHVEMSTTLLGVCIGFILCVFGKVFFVWKTSLMLIVHIINWTWQKIWPFSALWIACCILWHHWRIQGKIHLQHCQKKQDGCRVVAKSCKGIWWYSKYHKDPQSLPRTHPRALGEEESSSSRAGITGYSTSHSGFNSC